MYISSLCANPSQQIQNTCLSSYKTWNYNDKVTTWVRKFAQKYIIWQKNSSLCNNLWYFCNNQTSFKDGSVKIFLSKTFRHLTKISSLFVGDKVSQISVPSLAEYYVHGTLTVRNTSLKGANRAIFYKCIFLQIKKHQKLKLFFSDFFPNL